ncbi:hypothetical protein HXT27_05425 [Gardnerella sp. DNF00502]|uniref:hypothetical protein n=1 Tax=unclassified Gardnerella TaxID=2628112 RepID=UPI000C9F0ECE|nr:hypothetical protein [Gardnerella sp. KA00735]PNP89889.1 hypothetical protein BFS08_02870 [Gardnerella sp. KA00735]
MDSSNLQNNNYPQYAEQNNSDNSNIYTNSSSNTSNANNTDNASNTDNTDNTNNTNTYNASNLNPTNTYQSNSYQNNAYQNSGYQNSGYTNNTYTNNSYQNNNYMNNGYQNNGYQNNNYMNNGYQNNGYQNNNNPISTYINRDNLIRTYKNVIQRTTSLVNAILIDKHKKMIALIVASVLALTLIGSAIAKTFKPHYNCSAEKSANIEEYFHCHPSSFEKRGDDDVSATFDAKGDDLNITIKFTERVPDYGISKTQAEFSDRLLLTNMFPEVEEAKNKVISPIHLHYTFLNNDDSVIFKDDFIDN